MLQQNVFRGFDLRIDRSRPQKRLVLGPEDRPLPFMAWSAGQREFVPLLLGFYWLMPPSKAKTRDTIEWVVLEELEMGLHPRAIEVLLLMTMELMSLATESVVSSVDTLRMILHRHLEVWNLAAEALTINRPRKRLA